METMTTTKTKGPKKPRKGKRAATAPPTPPAPVAVAGEPQVGSKVRFRGGDGTVGEVIQENRGLLKVKWPAPWPSRWFHVDSLETVN